MKVARFETLIPLLRVILRSIDFLLIIIVKSHFIYINFIYRNIRTNISFLLKYNNKLNLPQSFTKNSHSLDRKRIPYRVEKEPPGGEGWSKTNGTGQRRKFGYLLDIVLLATTSRSAPVS